MLQNSSFKRSFHISALILFSLLTVFGSLAQTAIEDKKTIRVEKMIEWLEKTPGGYISSKVDIRRSNHSDPNSFFGIFVNEDVEKDELLMKIPDEMRLKLKDPSDNYIEDLCNLSWLLYEEFENGDNSVFAPYINYLREQPRGQIPAVWSPAGKDLLLKVQGRIYVQDYEPMSVKGEHLVNWIEEWFMESCLYDQEANISMDPHFLAMTTQRGFDTLLVPIFDMINHKKDQNIITKPSIYNDNGFEVLAGRHLIAGDELSFSYHDCPECGTTNEIWGTAEILRDFGFVEPYPQRFYLGNSVSFIIKDLPSTTLNGTDLEVEYIEGRAPVWQHIEEMKLELNRLDEVYEDYIIPSKGEVREYEYNTVLQYHQALTTAFKLIIEEEEKESWKNSITEKS